MLPIVPGGHSEVPSDQELGTFRITFGWQRRHCADESSMSSFILGPGLSGFHPLPLGIHRVVELLPVRRIRENLGKARHRPRKSTLPGGEVDQVLTERPTPTYLTPQVRVRINGDPELIQHRMKPSAAVTQQMEERIAIHSPTLSGCDRSDTSTVP